MTKEERKRKGKFSRDGKPYAKGQNKDNEQGKIIYLQ
jgi:hypothetical protein